MANYTQDLIMETFENMLDRMPFDKITVTALIKECNIGRNTFYYHYDDIYALLDEALIQWLGDYLDTTPEENWQENFKTILYFCRANKKKIHHIFNSLSRDQLAHYVSDRTNYSISSYIQSSTKIPGDNSERAKAIGQIIGYTLCGYFIRFLWNDMEDDIDADMDRLGLIFDELLEGLEKE